MSAPGYTDEQLRGAETAWRLIFKASHRLSPLVGRFEVIRSPEEMRSERIDYLLGMIVEECAASQRILVKFLEQAEHLTGVVEDQVCDAIREILWVASTAHALRTAPEGLSTKELQEAMLGASYALVRRVGIDCDQPRRWLALRGDEMEESHP